MLNTTTHKKMAISGFSPISIDFSSSQQLLLIFNGEKYEWGSIKVKTLLKSPDLWDLMEYRYINISISRT